MDKKAERGYYCGVMDIEVKSGTIDNMKVVDEYRIFNSRFVDSPELALLVSFDELNVRWKVDPKQILKDVVYDPEKKEWSRTFLETTKGHTPTEKQMEKWKRGGFVLNLITEYVQVMKTELIGNSKMLGNAISDWQAKMDAVKAK